MKGHLIGKDMANSVLQIHTQHRMIAGTQRMNLNQRQYQPHRNFSEIECHNHAVFETVTMTRMLYVARTISLEAVTLPYIESYPKVL